MAKPSRAALLQGTLDLLVLRTLSGGPLHGYAIARHILASSDDVLLVEEGSLYPALYRMEGRGWIRSEWGTSENGRRAKYYRLTPKGRARLRAELGAWQLVQKAIQQVLDHPPEGAPA
jgi:transcriptional regulator